MATIHVTTLDASGDGSFAAALASATDGDSILFSVAGEITGTYSTTAEIVIDAGTPTGSPLAYAITLTTLTASKATVKGIAATSLTASTLENCKAATASATTCANCEITSSATATTFDKCVFTGTFTDAAYVDCTFNATGTLTGTASFSRCAFTGTRILIRGSATIANSSFLNCTATNYGGAVFVCGRGTCAITDSTFSGCSSNHGGVCCVSGGVISLTDCELIESDFYSTAEAILTGCTAGNVYLRNRATLSNNTIASLDYETPETVHVTSTRDSGDGTFATEVANADPWTIIVCDVAITYGALSLSKHLTIIGPITLTSISSSSASIRLERARVGALTLTGWQSAYELDRCEVVNATASRLFTCSAAHYPSCYVKNSLVACNAISALASNTVSFDAIGSTFAANYNGTKLVSYDGTSCISQGTDDGFVNAPSSKPASLDADDWDFHLTPTSQHASATPSTPWDIDGRPRHYGAGAYDVIDYAETGKTKAFYDSGWKDARYNGATISDLSNVTDLYIDSGTLTGTFATIHTIGALSITGSCAGCELGRDADVEISGAAGAVDYLDGAKLEAASATITGKTNPLSVVDVDSITLVNCSQTIATWTGTGLTITGGSFTADDVTVDTANFSGTVAIDLLSVGSGDLGAATIGALTATGAVSSSGAIDSAVVSGALTTSGSIRFIELYGELIVPNTMSIASMFADSGVITVASSAILTIEAIDNRSELTVDGFVTFPSTFDLANVTGDRVMHAGNLVSASAVIDYDELELTLDKTGAIAVERKDGSSWVLVGFDDNLDAVPSEGVFDLRFCDGVKFTEITPARWYYYVGGDEGSFAEPTDWTLDAEHDHACTVAPTIDGCIFDCRRNGTR